MRAWSPSGRRPVFCSYWSAIRFSTRSMAPRALSSLFGVNRPVILDSTLNLHFIDSTNSTAALVSAKIIGFPPNVLGDSGGVPCIFKFLSSNVSRAINVGGPSV